MMNNLDAGIEEGVMLAQMDFQRNTIGHHEAAGLRHFECMGDLYSFVAVERLIERAVGGSITPTRQAILDKDASRLGGTFGIVKRALESVDENVHYSPYVELFIKIATELKLDPAILQAPDERWLSDSGVVFQRQLTRELLSRVGREAKAAKVQAAARRWREQAWADFNSASKYMDACFEVSPSLYVLRINFGFWGLLPVAVGSQHFSNHAEVIKVAFAGLVKRLATPQFNAIVGHIARLDYGREKGMFFHAAFFLKGGEAGNAIDWARRIGAIWQLGIPAAVTAGTESVSLIGRGAWTACNWVFFEQQWTKAPVVELVDGKKRADRLLLRQTVLPYLALSSLFGKVKVKPRERVFLRGTMPKPGASKLGRRVRQKGAKTPMEERS
jgi:hypothetical protein